MYKQSIATNDFHVKGHQTIRCPFQILTSYQGSFNRGKFVVK